MKIVSVNTALVVIFTCMSSGNFVAAQVLASPSQKDCRRHGSLVPRRAPLHGQSYVIVDDETLYVTGDASHERIIVLHAFDGDVIVQRSAKWPGGTDFGPWETFLPESQNIDEIIVDLGAGDDTFFNNTELPSTISGNAGHDVLLGGQGPDQIFGGSGGDVVFGFGGADYIEGGPQSDIVCGGYMAGNEPVFNFMTLETDYSKLKPGNFLDGNHVDTDMDELRGGFEDASVDADWFIMEVATDEFGSVMETSVAIDFIEDFDWLTFNNHQ